MQEFESLLNRQAERCESEIEQRILWFYAHYLSESIFTDSILFPKERALLPPPRGKYEETALRRPSILKTALLKAQLHDIVVSFGDMLRMRGSNTPRDLRERFGGKLDSLLDETMRLLDEEVKLCFLRKASVHETVERIQKKFAQQTARMIRTAEYHYRQAGWRWVMEAFSDMDPKKQTFTFSGGSCDDCASLNGESFTQDEIESQGIVPPLHPNCGCVLVPDRVSQSPENATWLAPALANFLQIPQEARAMFEAFLLSQQARLDTGSLAGILDWLSLGMASGLWNGMSQRTQTMMEQPSFYNAGNWLTMGLFDLGNQAVNPDRPLSLEHWLNSLGFASAIVGIYETVRSAVKLNGGRKQKVLPKRVPQGVSPEDLKRRPSYYAKEWGISAMILSYREAGLPEPRGKHRILILPSECHLISLMN